MPVSRQQYDEIARRVAETAPPGLSREDFDRLVTTEVDKFQQQPPDLTGQVLAALPAAVGTAASLAAGTKRTPTGMLAAGLGGMIGEAGRQVSQSMRGRFGDVPETALGRVTAIGRAGLQQAGAEAVGRGIVKGVRAVGKGLTTFATRPSPGLQKEFPGIIDTMLQERLAVRGAAGAPKAKRLLQESARTTRGLLAGSRQTFDPVALAQGVRGLEQDVASEALPRGPLRRVAAMKQQFLEARTPPPSDPGPSVPREFSAPELKALKRAEQGLAAPVFRAQREGQAVPLRARFADALAKEARRQLETIPGVAESEARTQRLIGATRAIRQAEARRLPLAAEIAAPVAAMGVGGLAGNFPAGVGTYLAARTAMSPAITSRAGLLLTSRGTTEPLRQLPRALQLVLAQQDLERQLAGQR